jgi:hypothetical protein
MQPGEGVLPCLSAFGNVPYNDVVLSPDVIPFYIIFQVCNRQGDLVSGDVGGEPGKREETPQG